jgi:hypothetical protein
MNGGDIVIVDIGRDRIVITAARVPFEEEKLPNVGGQGAE